VFKTVTTSVAVASLLGAGAALAACPTPQVVARVTGAPIFSHTSPGKFAFADLDDNTLYGIPVGATLNSQGDVIAGVLDPSGCLPPMPDRAITAQQITQLIAQNQKILEENAAFGTNMPLLTITFEVTADSFDADGVFYPFNTPLGPAAIVQGVEGGE
jgi:hypothetical protein